MSQWAQWRKDLQEVGGWDNELHAVPAGPVRKMIEAGELLEAAIKKGGGAPILVWPFHEAPKYLQELSRHGGDEDWLAYIPKGQDEPSWAYSGSSFGVCDVSRHELSGGVVVLIGAHAYCQAPSRLKASSTWKATVSCCNGPGVARR